MNAAEKDEEGMVLGKQGAVQDQEEGTGGSESRPRSRVRKAQEVVRKGDLWYVGDREFGTRLEAQRYLAVPTGPDKETGWADRKS